MNLKKIIFLSLFPFLAILLGDFCQKQTKGFWLQNMFSSSLESSFIPSLSKEETEEIECILNQPFHFMKKGQQCFTFLSQDEKYVLKLLRWDKLDAPFWTKWISTKKSQNLIRSKEEKKRHDFASYILAYTALRKETGLIYMGLSPNPSFSSSLEIYDHIRIRHQVPANEIAFILQKKVEDFSSFFTKNADQEKELHSFFSSLACILQNRYQERISDSDISLEYNMGILDNKPVLFDIGNLTTAAQTESEEEFLQYQARLIFSTLQKKNPSLAQFFHKELYGLTDSGEKTDNPLDHCLNSNRD